MMRLVQVRIAVPGNGTEVLWAEILADDLAKLVSVPVFAYGVSSGTIVRLAPRVSGDDSYAVADCARASMGSTVRLYCQKPYAASELSDELRSVAGTIAGAARTLLDPEIVAIHIPSRPVPPEVTNLLNDLIQRGWIRFWELADPSVGDAPIESPTEKPWELVHQIPVEGSAGVEFS